MSGYTSFTNARSSRLLDAKTPHQDWLEAANYSRYGDVSSAIRFDLVVGVTNHTQYLAGFPFACYQVVCAGTAGGSTSYVY